tara:strand:- start:48 stop:665 length:618 start_codon:yes stop_codon:yes gene_type:complete
MYNKMKAYIYKNTILETNKSYIGKHNGKDKYYKGSGVDYKRDLKKYKDIKTEILEYVEDISLLNDREIYWLEHFDVASNPSFYNKTNKSYGPKSQTEGWKLKQSQRMKGKSTTLGKSWVVKDTSNMGNGGSNLGKTWKCKKERTEETKKQLSESLKGRDNSKWKDKIYTKERNSKLSKSLKGRVVSEETKKKMQEAAKKRWLNKK